MYSCLRILVQNHYLLKLWASLLKQWANVIGSFHMAMIEPFLNRKINLHLLNLFCLRILNDLEIKNGSLNTSKQLTDFDGNWWFGCRWKTGNSTKLTKSKINFRFDSFYEPFSSWTNRAQMWNALQTCFQPILILLCENMFQQAFLLAYCEFFHDHGHIIQPSGNFLIFRIRI